MDIIDYYKWRYATKKFNPDKKIPISDIEIIKESIRLAPTSYGLQLFKVIIIENHDHNLIDCRFPCLFFYEHSKFSYHF